MKICDKCGAAIEDEIFNIRCPKCGNKLMTEEKVLENEPIKLSKKYVVIAAAAAILLMGLMFFLVWMQKPEPSMEEKLYGEWVAENGALTLTFQEDGTMRVGAGAGLFGVDILTYTIVDEDTIQLQVDQNGLLKEVPGQVLDVFSLQMDYVIEEDTMKISLMGTQYTLQKKEVVWESEEDVIL